MIRLFTSALMLIVLGTFATAQEQYRIQPGDVLQIEVLEDAIGKKAIKECKER